MTKRVYDTIFIFENLANGGSGIVGDFEWYGYELEAPHRRDYRRLAAGIAQGLALRDWGFDYVHQCWDPQCAAWRSPEQVFTQVGCHPPPRKVCQRIGSLAEGVGNGR